MKKKLKQAIWEVDTKTGRCVKWKSKEFENIKKEKQLEMIYLCCKKLFLLLTDFFSMKTEQLFSSRLSNFSVSSDIQYLRWYSQIQLKSSIYDETVHHKYTKAPKGNYGSHATVSQNLDSIIQQKRQHLFWLGKTVYWVIRAVHVLYHGQ